MPVPRAGYPIDVISIVTLVRNRNRMLRNLCASLDAQRSGSFDLTVVCAGGLQDPEDVVGRCGFDARVIELRDDAADTIDYSAARNLGARRASGEALLFVDADTMLGPDTVAALGQALAEHDVLCSGELRYLPPGHDDLGSPDDPATSTFDQLAATARTHPARPTLNTGIRFGQDHHLVWGLNMGVRRSTFERIGGFDETYQGYAGEDTDLARSLAGIGVPTAFVAGAVILHQHHDSFEPPVQQFRATLANAEHFFEKWGEWPMSGWLDGFERLGLIDRSPDAVEILRDPTPIEIEHARCSVAAPFR